MRKANDQKINEVFTELLKAYKLEGKMGEAKVINAWPVLMGSAVANRTTNIKLFERKLFITINSASLRQELFLAREKIRTMLNEEAGLEVVEEVVFR